MSFDLDYTNRQLEEMIDAVKERLRALTDRVTDLEREVMSLQSQTSKDEETTRVTINSGSAVESPIG
jgi:hypothetical protein